MESITEGWENDSGNIQHHFVDKIRNCRRNILRWRKNNASNGEKKISRLKRAMEKIHNNDNRSQEKLMEITKN